MAGGSLATFARTASGRFVTVVGHCMATPLVAALTGGVAGPTSVRQPWEQQRPECRFSKTDGHFRPTVLRHELTSLRLDSSQTTAVALFHAVIPLAVTATGAALLRRLQVERRADGEAFIRYGNAVRMVDMGHWRRDLGIE
jgi:hypothetical protein